MYLLISKTQLSEKNLFVDISIPVDIIKVKGPL